LFGIYGGRKLVLIKIQGCPTQVKFAEPNFFFYFDQNGLDLFEQIFGSTVGTFSKPWGKNRSKFGKFWKNPKNVGQKKYFFCRPRAVRCVIRTSIQLQHFFFARIFFFGESFEKCVLAPTPTHYPASEATVGKMFVCCWFCKCSERSEPREYVCCALNFVKAASEAGLTKAWKREN
jgi:hypothetical protein